MNHLRRRLLGLALGATALAACHAEAEQRRHVAFATPPSSLHPDHVRRAPAERPPSVVLVTIDGVRWEDLFRGASRAAKTPVDPALVGVPFGTMPRVRALFERDGVALGGGGEDCGIVRPANDVFVSLPGYRELLTGRRTACSSNGCARVDVPTILDDAASHAGRRGPVASISSWAGIARAASSGASTALVSAGRDAWPTEGRTPPEPLAGPLAGAVAAGRAARPFPGHEGYRPDRNTAEIALAYVEVARPRLLHVGLGDTDEYGHANDYAGYLRALSEADELIGRLDDKLRELGGPATFIVTTDHGRAATFRSHGPTVPESGRSFVVAFGPRIARRGALCHHHDVTLADVGATVRALAGLERDDAATAGSPIAELCAASPAGSASSCAMTD